METANVVMAKPIATIVIFCVIRFGGLSKLGMTPAGGCPAGPFRRACMANCICSGVGD